MIPLNQSISKILNSELAVLLKVVLKSAMLVKLYLIKWEDF